MPNLRAYHYWSVEFEEDGKSYYYITDDDTLQVGDYAEVLAGKNNHFAIVKVVKKEYFSEEDAPFHRKKQNALSENMRIQMRNYQLMVVSRC